MQWIKLFVQLFSLFELFVIKRFSVPMKSEISVPKLQSISENKCVRCKNLVKDDTFCPSCNSAYHQAYAKLTSVMVDGSFAKCCKTCTSPNTLHRPPLLPTKSNSILTSFTLTALVIEKTVEGLKPLLSSISDGADDFSNKLDRVTDRMIATETKVDELAERIGILEDTVAKLDNCVSVSEKKRSCNDCMYEFIERDKRKNNVILFGLVERTDQGVSDIKEEVINLFKILKSFKNVSLIFLF